MKLFTLAFLFVCSTAFGQTPDYFSNNPAWRCSIWSSNQWFPPYIPHWEHFVYYVNGDTIAGAYTYHRIWKRGYKDIDFNAYPVDEYFDYNTALYVRQEGRKIYYFDNQNDVDSLLIDYELNVGDSFSPFEPQGCYNSTDTIQKIDSVLVNTEYRKVFYIDTTSGPVYTEGIGHQSFIDFDEGHAFFEWCVGIGFTYGIHCYGNNDITYWNSDSSANTCYLSVGIETSESHEISVIQNPADQMIQLTQPLGLGEELFLINLQGQVIKRSTSNYMDVADIPSGTYILQLKSVSSNKGQTKLIIAH